MKNSRVLMLSVVIAAFGLVTAQTFADHAWSTYHWERASNPVSLTLGDNFANPAWSSSYNTAVSDWNQSKVLSLSKVPGATSPRRCKAATGAIEVCSDTYGNTGWLGIAGISVSGDHIVAAYAKMNDTYYCPGCSYDTSAWRAFVMCQEIGHDFGLDHQDENFNNSNLGTCMDYTNSPGTNQHPNQHDYQQLESIYSHLDGGGSGGGCKGKNCAVGVELPMAMRVLELDATGQWGELIWRSEDGHQEVFELDFGNGFKHLTHVLWVEGYDDLSADDVLHID